jgi:hypothetical protein
MVTKTTGQFEGLRLAATERRKQIDELLGGKMLSAAGTRLAIRKSGKNIALVIDGARHVLTLDEWNLLNDAVQVQEAYREATRKA